MSDQVALAIFELDNIFFFICQNCHHVLKLQNPITMLVYLNWPTSVQVTVKMLNQTEGKKILHGQNNLHSCLYTWKNQFQPLDSNFQHWIYINIENIFNITSIHQEKKPQSIHNML